MERASTTAAVFVGAAMGWLGFVLTWQLSGYFSGTFSNYETHYHLAFAGGFLTWVAVAVGWRQVRSTVCCWSVGAGAIAVPFSQQSLLGMEMEPWQARGMSFLIALGVALLVGLLVEKVTRRAGPRVLEGADVIGGFLLAFGLFVNVSRTLVH